MILNKVNNFYHGSDTGTIESLLSKGLYKIHAFFQPTPVAHHRSWWTSYATLAK
jgi:hypothetical protein